MDNWNPNNDENENIKKSVEELYKEIILKPISNRNKAFEIFEISKIKWKEKNYNESYKYVQHAIDFHNKTAIFYNGRGLCRYRLKKFYLSIFDFTKAIILNDDESKKYFESKDICLFYNRGDSYSKLGFFELAMKDYEVSIKQNTNCMEVFKSRGDCNVRMRKYELGYDDYSRAIDCSIKMKGKMNITSDLTEEEKSAFLYFERGIIAHKLGYFSKALCDYSKALSLTENEFEAASLGKGLIFFRQNKFKESLKNLKKFNTAVGYYTLIFVGDCFCELFCEEIEFLKLSCGLKNFKQFLNILKDVEKGFEGFLTTNGFLENRQKLNRKRKRDLSYKNILLSSIFLSDIVVITVRICK